MNKEANVLAKAPHIGSASGWNEQLASFWNANIVDQELLPKSPTSDF